MRSKFLSYGLFAASLFVLSSCTLQDVYGPNPTPRGYAHLKRDYKTVQPARPFFIGVEYSAEETAESEALWLDATRRLVDQMDAEILIKGLSISLQPVNIDSGFEVRMDYYLRQELVKRGYMIVQDSLPTIPMLRYYAYYPGYRHGLQKKGRSTDVEDLRASDQAPYNRNIFNMQGQDVILGLSVYDLAAPAGMEEMLRVETLQIFPERDVHEIKDTILNPRKIMGISPDANIHKIP